MQVYGVYPPRMEYNYGYHIIHGSVEIAWMDEQGHLQIKELSIHKRSLIELWDEEEKEEE